MTPKKNESAVSYRDRVITRYCERRRDSWNYICWAIDAFHITPMDLALYAYLPLSIAGSLVVNKDFNFMALPGLDFTLVFEYCHYVQFIREKEFNKKQKNVRR